MPDSSIESEPYYKLHIGLDFGTSYSGYGQSHVAEPDNVEAFFHWADSEVHYCKTLTALWYERQDDGKYVATAWGHTARKRALNARARSAGKGMYVS
ncbi:hypothetical protein KIPB_012634, partial [Kipferlia bialata]|eukprot:g12634.t1